MLALQLSFGLARQASIQSYIPRLFYFLLKIQHYGKPEWCRRLWMSFKWALNTQESFTGSRGIKNYLCGKDQNQPLGQSHCAAFRLEAESPNAELRKDRVKEGNTKPTHFQSSLIRCYPLLNWWVTARSFTTTGNVSTRSLFDDYHLVA